MTTEVTKMTVSVPKHLISLADEIAKEKNMSRSKLVALCLQELAERRLRSEMEEGYKAMAEEQRKFARLSFDLQRKSVPEWK